MIYTPEIKGHKVQKILSRYRGPSGTNFNINPGEITFEGNEQTFEIEGSNLWSAGTDATNLFLCYVRINNDTGSNYKYTYTKLTGTTPTVVTTTTSYIRIGEVPAQHAGHIHYKLKFIVFGGLILVKSRSDVYDATSDTLSTFFTTGRYLSGSSTLLNLTLSWGGATGKTMNIVADLTIPSSEIGKYGEY